MSLYHLRVSQGHHDDLELSMDCPTRNAAWTELTSICGDLIRDVTRTLQEDGQWQIELLDQTKRPVGRIRLVAESGE